MARPRKNTTEAPTENSAEFDYEKSEELYHQVMLQGAVATPQVMNAQAAPAPAPTFPEYTPWVAPNSLIFFVEGKVRLDQEGASAIFSDQRRIVNAANIDEAIQKFMNYFSGMSNPSQRYTVVAVTASEAIL
jgi:hypothetical protein